MKRYFVDNIHRASDAGAMERDLVEFAGRNYANVLVDEDKIWMIEQEIKAEQLRIIKERPRRRGVSIKWEVSEIVPGHAYVTIGTSQMNLTLVRGEVR